MKLTDEDILEVNELCQALVDGRLATTQRARLEHWLAHSDEARKFYVQQMALSASLFDYAGEMQAEQPESTAVPNRFSMANGFRWALGPLAAATALAVALWITAWIWSPKTGRSRPDAQNQEFVARLTASKHCRWTSPDTARKPGDHLAQGWRLDLAAGLAEITFDSGALVVLEGPAALELDSAWNATLHHGTLRASVPAEAVGFRVASASVEVADLGTEFSMITDRLGNTEVFVIQGAVEAVSANALGLREPMMLRERQARRFSHEGVSEINDSEQRLARLARKQKLDRPQLPVGYMHWSFDEPDERLVRAEVSGMPAASFDAHLEGLASRSTANLRSEGRWKRALSFDGLVAAHALLPPVAASGARTVAFWVKLPADTRLTDEDVVLAWRTKNSRKLGGQAVAIGWNHRPGQGALGALRTEGDRSVTVGSTPLRDGQWHHIAVVFVPGVGAGAAAQVKQYVDGRLEDVTSKPSKLNPKRRHPPPAAETVEGLEAAADKLWLGRRLGKGQTGGTFFRGDVDELFIAERALTPQEIHRLMKFNQPPQAAQTELAAATNSLP